MNATSPETTLIDKLVAYKWRTWIAFVLMWVGILMSWDWIYAALLGFWTVNGIVTRQTYLIEIIEQDERPTLFWLLTISYGVFTLWLIATPFLPRSFT